MLHVDPVRTARRIYLSAAFARRQEAEALSSQLAARGCEVVSSWHCAEGHGSGEVAFDAASDAARQDLKEVKCADLVVVLTQSAHTPLGRGGRHVELGAAMAWGIPVAIVGPPENIFHALVVAAFETRQDFLDSFESVPQPLAA